jgi:hypothetical protein
MKNIQVNRANPVKSQLKQGDWNNHIKSKLK